MAYRNTISSDTAGSFSNLGISYNAGTGVFSVLAANGSDLSAANPAYVMLPGKATPGTLKRYTITANQSFIDDNGASEIIGNLFGYTTGVAVSVTPPFFIYAVCNDNEDTIQFMLSRIPNRKTSPVSGDIGTPASAIADNQWSFWSFDSVTTTLYDGNPCCVVGSIRMNMSASDDWTVQTINTVDGMATGAGAFQTNTVFNIPKGQFGSAASTMTIANGGTSPAFVTSEGQYHIDLSGFCYYEFLLNGDNGTDGAGAVDAKIILPFMPYIPANNSSIPAGESMVAYAGGNLRVVTAYFTSATNDLNFRESNSATAVQWSQFTNGSRNIQGSVYYRVKDA